MLLNKRKKKPGLKFDPGLALMGLQTTGPRATWVHDLLLSAETNPALQSLKVKYDFTDPWIPDV